MSAEVIAFPVRSKSKYTVGYQLIRETLKVLDYTLDHEALAELERLTKAVMAVRKAVARHR